MKKKIKITQPKIILKPTAKNMAGSTDLEKALNCYLTKRFVFSTSIPEDECLPEAKRIIKLFRKYGWVEWVYEEENKN
jgi:hypothetical protein